MTLGERLLGLDMCAIYERFLHAGRNDGLVGRHLWWLRLSALLPSRLSLGAEPAVGAGVAGVVGGFGGEGVGGDAVDQGGEGGDEGLAGFVGVGHRFDLLV